MYLISALSQFKDATHNHKVVFDTLSQLFKCKVFDPTPIFFAFVLMIEFFQNSDYAMETKILRSCIFQLTLTYVKSIKIIALQLFAGRASGKKHYF